MEKGILEQKLELFALIAQEGVYVHPFLYFRQVKLYTPEKAVEIWKNFFRENPDGFLSMYLNIPYCKHNKCRFCMYRSKVIEKDSELDIYLDYIENEIETYLQISQKHIFSAGYIGGGTPTLLDVKQLSRLFSIINRAFKFSSEARVTFEISPETVEQEKLRLAAENGVNRISMGVQSCDMEVLSIARRKYMGPERLKTVVGWIREAGFLEFNIDIMMGLPGDTEESFAKSVEQVLSLKPDTLTVYYLRLENTRYPVALKKESKKICNAEMIRRMVDILREKAVENGFRNHFSDYHGANHKFMRNDYQIGGTGFPTNWDPELVNSCLGIGVGAKSYIRDMLEYVNIGPYGLSRNNFSDALEPDFMNFSKTIYQLSYNNKNVRMRDYVMRKLYDGKEISYMEFKKLYGEDILEVFREEIELLISLGKLELSSDAIKGRFSDMNDWAVYSKFFLDDETLQKMIKTKFPSNIAAS